MWMEEVKDLLAIPFRHFLQPSQRVYSIYLLSSLLLAGLVFRRIHRGGGLKSFLNYCFPATTIRHRGMRTDFAFFVINRILLLALLAPAVVEFGQALTDGLLASLSRMHPQSLSEESSLWVTYLFALCLLLANDFALWVAHRLSHAIPFLWNFHKVHHSAEVLTPITVYRMHPMDDLLALLGTGVASAIVYSIFYTLWPTVQLPVTFMGVSVVLVLFYFLGFNLRHSHIPLSFGPLNKWVISPVQHQIHHSNSEEHYDKNFGVMLAVWDRLFGTLLLPSKETQFAFGLGEEGSRFTSVMQCYIEPFRQNFRRSRVMTGLVFVGFVALGAGTVAQSVRPEKGPGSLWLEDLTWKETEDLIASGMTTAIVATGGVEQRGLHVVLGSHNKVVAVAAEGIAKKLKNALIAPVVTYVPEGDIATKAGHMSFAGTLSVRESTFEAILEDTCRSLAAHGFTRIVLIGDSLGNQKGQANVAEKLKGQLPHAKVLNVREYYFENGQIEWLQQKGFSKASIGSHAGVRDTSEIMFASPTGVRENLRKKPGQGLEEGVSGAYWKASRELGEVMLKLKIDRAVTEIESTSR